MLHFFIYPRQFCVVQSTEFVDEAYMKDALASCDVITQNLACRPSNFRIWLPDLQSSHKT